MRKAFLELATAIANRKKHFFIFHGNVYDSIPFADQEFGDIVEFLIGIESLKSIFPWCLAYDIFSGARIIKGEKKDIAAVMGIKEEPVSGDNAALIDALKKSKGQAVGEFPIEPEKIFPCFDALLRKASNPTMLIIDYADSLIPKSLGNLNRYVERALAVGLIKWSKDQKIRQAGHLIVLVCRNARSLDITLLDRVFEANQFRFPKPAEDERREYLEKSNPASAAFLAKATAGLSFKDLQEVIASVPPEARSDDALRAVFALKKKILTEECGDLLEIIAPRFGFEAIGGLDWLKEEFGLVARDMREGDYASVPQGILMMGPPGTGKTIFAETMAKEAGVNCVKLLNLKSMWLGESESNTDRVYAILKDLAPVIVFFDEIDQNQRQRGGFDGDSGVSAYLFKRLLEITSESAYRGKILFMFATNRPDLLDSALKRDGRCDMRVALLPYNAEDLAKICPVASVQYPEIKTNIKNWLSYTKRCKGYSGANIIEIVRRAWVCATRNNRQAINREDMEWALADYRPQIADEKANALSSLHAILNCSSNGLMPPNWKEIQDDCERILFGTSPPSLGDMIATAVAKNDPQGANN